MAHRSTRTTQYQYFNTHFGGIDWTNKKILDFGGNIGGFLSGAPNNINQKNYWCIDVDKGAIEIGQKRYPLAHFNWFNRYSSYDNPTGVAGLKIPFESERFDIIISFSVFTHVSKVDMIDLLGQLKALLNPGGILGFTFFDTFYDPTQDQNWDRNAVGGKFYQGPNLGELVARFTKLGTDTLVAQAKESRWCTLVNDIDFRIEPPDDACPIEEVGAQFLQFYDSNFIQNIIPGGKICLPIAPERQHCVVIRN